jgi:hypothetical protein
VISFSAARREATPARAKNRLRRVAEGMLAGVSSKVFNRARFLQHLCRANVGPEAHRVPMILAVIADARWCCGSR